MLVCANTNNQNAMTTSWRSTESWLWQCNAAPHHALLNQHASHQKRNDCTKWRRNVGYGLLALLPRHSHVESIYGRRSGVKLVANGPVLVAAAAQRLLVKTETSGLCLLVVHPVGHRQDAGHDVQHSCNTNLNQIWRHTKQRVSTYLQRSKPQIPLRYRRYPQCTGAAFPPLSRW